MLALAIALISLALVFYTVGVWAERRSGELRWWHVGAFAAGLTADISGTTAMGMIATSGGPTGVEQDPFPGPDHSDHRRPRARPVGPPRLAWATITMLRNRPEEKRAFHRFSVIVWAIWLLPYLTGMAAAMAWGRSPNFAMQTPGTRRADSGSEPSKRGNHPPLRAPPRSAFPRPCRHGVGGARED